MSLTTYLPTYLPTYPGVLMFIGVNDIVLAYKSESRSHSTPRDQGVAERLLDDRRETTSMVSGSPISPR
jgi:hypothetical protein